MSGDEGGEVNAIFLEQVIRLALIGKARFPRKALTVGLLAGCAATGLQAGSLTGAFSSITAGSNVDLTVSGKLDWVHWGLYTDTSVHRKATVTPLISNFSVVGDAACSHCFLAAYQYGDNPNGYTWYDGAPVAAITNTTTGVWAYNYPLALGSGFQLTAPADTSTRILQVFVGAYEAEGKLTASLSDGSGSFTSSFAQTVNNITSGPGGVFALTYSANSAGQTLTVTWAVAVSHGAPDAANVTLQAAALTALGADNPPFAVITNPVNNATFPEHSAITIQADAHDFDAGGSVTNVSFYAGATKLGQATSSPYSFTWSNVSRGHYTLTASTTDKAGLTSWAAPLDIFVYGTGGSQISSGASPPSAVDLTAEGTADWTHWGLVTNTSFDYKSLVQRKISDFTALGTNAVQQYSDNPIAFSWSDGTPTPVANGTTTGMLINGITNGFSLTAPADGNPRQLNVYVGGYGSQGEFQAWLSDFSAPAYGDTSISNVFGTSDVVYSINYTAASPGQQLIVVYRALGLFDMLYGNVSLQAVTLQGGPPEPLPVSLLNPMMVGSSFIFSFLTQSNFSYAVQSLGSLSSTNWTTLTTLPGTGGTVSVTNQNVSTGPTYYRVRTQ
jgi:Bacterial Ig domain